MKDEDVLPYLRDDKLPPVRTERLSRRRRVWNRLRSLRNHASANPETAAIPKASTGKWPGMRRSLTVAESLSILGFDFWLWLEFRNNQYLQSYLGGYEQGFTIIFLVSFATGLLALASLVTSLRVSMRFPMKSFRDKWARFWNPGKWLQEHTIPVLLREGPTDMRMVVVVSKDELTSNPPSGMVFILEKIDELAGAPVYKLVKTNVVSFGNLR